VISYEGLITGADLDGYITFNNKQVGQIQAQYIADHVAHGSTIAVMNGAQVCAACIDFKKGAHEVLDPLVTSGELTIGYEADTPDWLTANAQSQTEQALTQLGDDVSAVYAANDGLAEGVIAALKARQLNGKVVVTGQDATIAGLQEILLGNQTMTVYKDLHQQAKAAAKAAVAVAQGKKNDTGLTDTFDNDGHRVPALFLEPVALDLSNIKTVFDDGFVTKDQVCTGEVASKCDF
jgi:D-xylose transport system substrate-binding protein